MLDLLKKLSEAHGVPGKEDEVRKMISEELSPHCDVQTDKMGNLICRKGDGEKKVMLAAHMDEIGLMVKQVDDDGFIRFATLGGFFDQTLLNQRVIVHTSKERLYGVIGSKPPHMLKEEERKKVVEYKKMFIDIGAKDNKAATKLGVEIGDRVTFDRSFKTLGGDYITGKGFDDRLGCAVMVEVTKQIKLKKDVTLYAVGTVQEEVGLKGAKTAAYKLDPDIALVSEVTVAGDFPGAKEDVRTSLGKGPAITLADASGRGLITHPTVKDLLINTAKKNKIPYQLEVSEGGTTDATAIHMTKEGVPSGVVAIPTRYLHSPVEVANLKDIKNAVKLITLAIKNY